MAESTLDLSTVKRRRHETILVVDNEPSIRELLGAILGRVGYSVRVAANACEAASIFEGHLTQIDLIEHADDPPILAGPPAHQAATIPTGAFKTISIAGPFSSVLWIRHDFTARRIPA